MDDRYNNNDRYNQFRQPYQDISYHSLEQPKRKKSRGGAPLGLVILLAFLAGIGGGGLAWTVMDRYTETPESLQASVIIQAAESAMESAPESDVQRERETASAAEPAPYSYSIAEEVAAKAGPSVVEVTTESKMTHPLFGSYVTSGAGSGVIISEDGYLVTNNHVIEGSTTVSVRLSDGADHPAVVVGADQQTDLAVLKIDAAGLSPATLADSDTVSVGQPVVAIGNPLGTLGGTVTEGIISAKDREIVIGDDVMLLLQTSAAINPGNSGGGLFNRDSQLVGVVNAKSAGSDIEGLGFAIPANKVRTVISELIEHGYVTGRPSLGIEVVEINTREALYRYRVSDYGVYIGVAAKDSGLLAGDRLISVDGEQIHGIADVKRAVNRHAVGDKIDVTVQRGGRQQTLSVSLREKPKNAGAYEI